MDLSRRSRARVCAVGQARHLMAALPRALTETLSAHMFQHHLVAPLQRVVAEFLRSAPSLYLRSFPKFAHLDPTTLPLEVLCDGCLTACKRETA